MGLRASIITIQHNMHHCGSALLLHTESCDTWTLLTHVFKSVEKRYRRLRRYLATDYQPMQGWDGGGMEEGGGGGGVEIPPVGS